MILEELLNQLYIMFSKKFKKPVAFYNMYCCVSKSDESNILSQPLELLTEDVLAKPFDHYGSCFGTFDEISYYVPRLIDILAHSKDGFSYGSLCFSFFRFLIENENRYHEMNLWNPIESIMKEIFDSRIENFSIGEMGGVVNQEIVDMMLSNFFYPLMSKRRFNVNNKSTEWDHFILDWVNTKDPP